MSGKTCRQPLAAKEIMNQDLWILTYWGRFRHAQCKIARVTSSGRVYAQRWVKKWGRLTDSSRPIYRLKSDPTYWIDVYYEDRCYFTENEYLKNVAEQSEIMPQRQRKI